MPVAGNLAEGSRVAKTTKHSHPKLGLLKKKKKKKLVKRKRESSTTYQDLRKLIYEISLGAQRRHQRSQRMRWQAATEQPTGRAERSHRLQVRLR